LRYFRLNPLRQAIGDFAGAEAAWPAEQERARARHRRAAYAAAAAMLNRAISLGATLLTIRVTLAYLGTERFGLWMTISTLQLFLAFADLGIGNGVLNAIAEATGRDDQLAIRRYIGTGFVLLGLVSMLMLAAIACAYPLLDFGRFFNLHSEVALREIKPALAIFAVCFAFEIPLGLIARVQLGLQLGFLSSLWQTAGSLLTLVSILAAVHMRGGLPVLVLVFCGVPLLARVMNVGLFFRQHPELVPTAALVSWEAAHRIAHIAVLFVVLNLSVALAFQSDNLIIAHLLGPDAVAQFSVPQKLFSLVALGLATIMEPLWPAYGEAISRGDGPWVKRTLTRSLIGALVLATMMSALFVLLGPWLIRLWVGDKISPNMVLLVGLACWAVVQAGGNAVAMFLNGANIIREQVIVALIFAPCAFAAKIAFVHRWGIEGMPWATLTPYFLLTIVPYAVMVPGIASRVCRPQAARLAPSADRSA
jgi:O-antigen/teichoic acid export membrane protein